MKKALALVLTLSMLLALCAFSPAAFADEADDYYIELTYSNVFNPKEWNYKAAEKFAEMVTEKTEGHVKVTFHGLNELDCYRDSVVHAVNGDKWIGLEEPSLFADWVGDCAVLVGPMLYNNDEEYNYVMDSAIVKGVQAALAEANRRVYGGGQFVWPAPNYTRISDDYGMRMHPTLGVEKFHNGIDLAAPSGSPILAAYDGDVVGAGYSSTMGNYLMIDHGDGLLTIYMHASKLYVSTGAAVSKGQKIAAVGSTGRSTGPHLHFGVRLNGNYVSPWKYLK